MSVLGVIYWIQPSRICSALIAVIICQVGCNVKSCLELAVTEVLYNIPECCPDNADSRFFSPIPECRIDWVNPSTLYVFLLSNQPLCSFPDHVFVLTSLNYWTAWDWWAGGLLCSLCAWSGFCFSFTLFALLCLTQQKPSFATCCHFLWQQLLLPLLIGIAFIDSLRNVGTFCLSPHPVLQKWPLFWLHPRYYIIANWTETGQ